MSFDNSTGSSFFYCTHLKTVILKLDMKKGGKMMYLCQTNNFEKTKETGKYTLFEVFIKEKT
jgi:hypothetical protein